METQIFECQQCGDCCWGRGGVRLDPNEAAFVATFLGITSEELATLYLNEGPPPWDIRTGPDGFCLFHQDNGTCLIHAVKPMVCAQWPFLPSILNDESAFNDAALSCLGFVKNCGWVDFKKAAPKNVD
ncbi:MAG: YkgJ family cysteine cluster protein [Candidatus Adiutrix sp.]